MHCSRSSLCWNLLESTQARITLIKSIHKWTQMLFIISNSKIGIWLCSQPRIDLNSQSNFYDVLTRPYKYLVQQTIKTLYKKNMHSTQSTCYFHQVMIISRFFRKFLSLYILHWQYPIVTTTYEKNFELLKCQSQNFLTVYLTTR